MEIPEYGQMMIGSSPVQSRNKRSWARLCFLWVLLVGLVAVACSSPTSQNTVWTRLIEGDHPLNASDLTIDDTGNVYVVGRMGGVFLRKYNSDGNELWRRLLSMATDMMTRDGYFYPHVRHDGGGNLFVVGARGPFFLGKYDSDGNELSTREWGRRGETAIGASISIDEAGSLYVTGRRGGSVYLRKLDIQGKGLWTRDFPAPAPGASVRVLKQDGVGNVYVAGTMGTFKGAFLLKYDRDGKQLWTRQFGVNSLLAGWGDVETDTAGRVYVAGGVDGASLGKYDVDGNQVWDHQFSSSQFDQASNVTLDKEGNAYVAWAEVSVYGLRATHVSKLDSTGSELWTRQVGGSNEFTTVRGDGAGNIYVVGWKGQGRKAHISARKYNSGGDVLWTDRRVGFRDSQVDRVRLDGFGNLYLLGSRYPGREPFVVKISGVP